MCVCVWGGGGGGGEQPLSQDVKEVEIFFLLLMCGRGVESPHNFACPTKILHPQSIISLPELSLPG